VSLTILGDGPQYQPLSELVEELDLQDAVCLPGRVPTQQVADFLSNADMYVSATTTESFGLAVAEAAAHALPIVTTRVGFPAALVVDGLTGYVVETNDRSALTNAMEQLLSDPDRCREAGLKMRQRIREMSLTWPRAADRLLEIYRALCKDAAL
jgi:glycosyltransferase involved in cell wall biosynthesis